MNPKSLCLFLLVAAFGLASPSQASAILRQSLPQLVEHADAIVHGHVRSVKSRWSRNNRRIITDIELEVIEALKGNPASRIVVQQLGGVVGDIGQHVSGLATFSPGEEVMVFLGREPKNYFVSGMAQGKFHIDRSKSGAAVVMPERITGTDLIDPITRQPTAPSTQAVDLEIFRQTVRTLLGKQGAAPGQTP